MEGLLFGMAESILIKLSSKVYQEISSAHGVCNDLKDLANTISIIKAKLSDSQLKKSHNNAVCIWMEQLKDVLYEAEDVFDEFDYEGLRKRTTKKVMHFFPINSFKFKFKMAHRIKEIRKKLDVIASQRQAFDLIERETETDYFSHTIREMTHSFIHESEMSRIVGRDDDKERIVQFLVHSNNNRELSIISLVGMGGLGKTTLAKLIYNDHRIKQSFQKKMWVCVSMDFDVQRLTREILSSTIDSEISESLTMDQLQSKLREKLVGQRFILVLDDVWNENVNKWRDLRQFLMVGAKGSKILVTTRMNSVSDVMNSDEKHELRGLSEEESWSLFAKYVTEEEKEMEISCDLKRIGEEIIKKCEGVPLAIRSLGSLMYSKTSAREWESIKDSDIWKLEDEREDGILPALKLSYNLMPSYLKPCFVYCAILPKDYVYSYDRIIGLWMAQGMLHSKTETEELEDVGERYVKELYSRSFFQNMQRSEINFDYTFKMHNLVHDLALSIARDKYLTIESDIASGICEDARHLYLSGSVRFTGTHFKPLKSVRSVAFAPRSGFSVYFDCYKIIDECITKFKFLRVLELESVLDESLPQSIGRLKHLKYLNLRRNFHLKSLPNSICELWSLQTLILERCDELEALPRGLEGMISLRYLWINGMLMSQLLRCKFGIEILSNLRFLAINDRPCLPIPTYCGRFNMENEEEEQAINSSTVIQSKLQTLHLQYLSWVAFPQWLRSFAKTLRRLRIIRCYELHTLPEWLSEFSLLETLEIMYSKNLSQRMDNLTSLTNMVKINIVED